MAKLFRQIATNKLNEEHKDQDHPVIQSYLSTLLNAFEDQFDDLHDINAMAKAFQIFTSSQYELIDQLNHHDNQHHARIQAENRELREKLRLIQETVNQ